MFVIGLSRSTKKSTKIFCPFHFFHHDFLFVMFLCHVLCLSRQQQTCAIEKKERPFQFPKRVLIQKKMLMMKSFTVGGKRKREPHLLDYLGCYHRQGLRRGTCVSTIANLLLGDNHSLQSVEAAISIFDRYMATSTRVFFDRRRSGQGLPRLRHAGHQGPRTLLSQFREF